MFNDFMGDVWTVDQIVCF